jgi:hypothetical protein
LPPAESPPGGLGTTEIPQSHGQDRAFPASLASRQVDLTSIELGSTVYPFQRSVTGVFTHQADDRVTFRVNELAPYFLGQGRDELGAEEDWKEQVHRRFQKLYPKLSCERNDEEEATLDALKRVIDVTEYQAKLPLRMHQIGHVSSLRPPTVIWYSGREEVVGLDRMPGRFAALDVGQWFEADVLRDPQNGTLLHTTLVEPIEPIVQLDDEVVQEFWSGLTPLEPDAGTAGDDTKRP